MDRNLIKRAVDLGGRVIRPPGDGAPGEASLPVLHDPPVFYPRIDFTIL